MKGVAFAGSLIVDHIKQIDCLPGRSELARIRTVERSTGGCVCNTGIDFRMLAPDIPVSAIGAVGDDGDGDLILKTLRDHGIDTTRVIRRGITSFTDVFAEKDGGARTFFQYGGACDTFDISDIDFAGLDCDIFHIGYLLLLDRLDAKCPGYGTRMAKLLSRVQACGVKTSIDVVSESGDRFAKIVGPALRYVDYLTLNEIEAGKTVGVALRDADGKLLVERIREVLMRLFALGVGEWAVIHCPEGAWGLGRSGVFVHESSAKLPRGYIAGTVGAGDAFCAGVLLAACGGLTIGDALTYGNAAAQVSLKSASASGGIVPMPRALSEYRKHKKRDIDKGGEI